MKRVAVLVAALTWVGVASAFTERPPRFPMSGPEQQRYAYLMVKDTADLLDGHAKVLSCRESVCAVEINGPTRCTFRRVHVWRVPEGILGSARGVTCGTKR